MSFFQVLDITDLIPAFNRIYVVNNFPFWWLLTTFLASLLLAALVLSSDIDFFTNIWFVDIVQLQIMSADTNVVDDII